MSKSKKKRKPQVHRPAASTMPSDAPSLIRTARRLLLLPLIFLGLSALFLFVLMALMRGGSESPAYEKLALFTLLMLFAAICGAIVCGAAAIYLANKAKKIGGDAERCTFFTIDGVLEAVIGVVLLFRVGLPLLRL